MTTIFENVDLRGGDLTEVEDVRIRSQRAPRRVGATEAVCFTRRAGGQTRAKAGRSHEALEALLPQGWQLDADRGGKERGAD